MSIFTILRTGNMSLLQTFIDQGNDINETDVYGNTSLHLAVCCNQIEMVQVLLKNNINVNIKNNNGYTSLLFVIDNIDILKMLLKHGANTNFQDDRGWTALLYACNNKNYEFIEELLHFNADINIKPEWLNGVISPQVNAFMKFYSINKELWSLWEL